GGPPARPATCGSRQRPRATRVNGSAPLRSSATRPDGPSVHWFIEERKHVRISRINGRSALCVGLAAAAVAVAAGCGDNDSSASGGSTNSSSASGGGGSSDAIVAEAKKSVEAAKKGLPAKYSGPTEPVTN